MASSPKKRRRVRQLSIEQLAPRVVFDAVGLPWFDPGQLTYSFAPDGTVVAGQESSLFADLTHLAAEDQWKLAFDNAFSSWMDLLETSAIPVDDSGAPFGTFGPTQHDKRFGDVRIASIPMSNKTLATSIPHTAIVQGSWAGDILLNANANWSSLQQVYSVALHEIGHVLGLEHSSDPTSPMFIHGVNDAAGPTESDIENLLELYSGLEIDSSHPTQPKIGNDAATEAIILSPTLGNSVRYIATGELISSHTKELYQLELPASEIDHANFLNVTVQAGQVGGFVPGATITDSRGRSIDSETLSSGAGFFAIQAKDISPGETYFVQVESLANGAAHRTGEYEIIAEFVQTESKLDRFFHHALDGQAPRVEQSFSIDSSRLIHFLMESKSDDPDLVVWATILDSQGTALIDVGQGAGLTRSAPLTLLAPGDYRLILQASRQGSVPDSKVDVNVFIDQVSIDIGPGAIDPTTVPALPCSDILPSSITCIPTVTSPTFIDAPYLPPTEIVLSDPTYINLPWSTPDQSYWPFDPAFVTPPSTTPTPPINPTTPPTTPTNPKPTTPSPAPSQWTNPTNAFDVNNDSIVSPLDALLVLNFLRVNQTSNLILDAPPNSPPAGFFDTNGDQIVTPLDALMVINRIRVSLNNGEASGEQVLTPDQSYSITPTEFNRRNRRI